MEKGNELGATDSAVGAAVGGAASGVVSGVVIGAAGGTAAVVASSTTRSAGPKTYTAEDRELLQEIYKGADQAGVKIVGISKVKTIEDSFAGSKDAPVAIGKAAVLVLGVGKDGSLMAPDDERATSTLEIDVRPGVEFDSSGVARVIWNGYTRQIDRATRKVTGTSRSGPSPAEREAKQGGRPDHVAANDPKFQDWIIESSAGSPAEAVRKALSNRK